jgi:hypothetical protein
MVRVKFAASDKIGTASSFSVGNQQTFISKPWARDFFLTFLHPRAIKNQSPFNSIL